MPSIQWKDNYLFLLNQTLLPNQVQYIECHDYRIVAEAIKRLEVRGAPAIGVAAAFGIVLGAREFSNSQYFWTSLLKVAEELGQTRPTAVNLFWAIERMMAVASRYDQNSEIVDVVSALEQEAVAIADEDVAINSKIAHYGAELFTTPVSVLTHCNAGALATAGVGTALGVIRQAFDDGNITKVFADETRPLLQGARLTAWELVQDHIPVTLITDNMAGWVMKKNMVQAVIVGADRITLNGDVANKIGTYSVAVLAKEHNIPFYVAAPVSTFDFTMESGFDIPIEERDASEVAHFAGMRTAPEGVDVFNPAFDVTPNSLVTGIITEYGVLRGPYREAITELQQKIKGV
ncbi:S-methyl-5-thioribose-1-phosphate isomerase [Pelosinus sp. sgz500959]|uniref:S-methyl-5-thioribose-1-phosphate isomerase n=1 Tax=Pelosinus sp. sgz500959 TaxID=3242472 RepID=UPI00366DF56F